MTNKGRNVVKSSKQMLWKMWIFLNMNFCCLQGCLEQTWRYGSGGGHVELR